MVIGFINHLQVVTKTKYNIVTDFHTTNHSTLIFSVYFHWSSLSVSWQRICNTLTVNKSSNHTLSLTGRLLILLQPNSSSLLLACYYSTLQLTACLLLFNPPAYCLLATTQPSSLLLACYYSTLQLTATSKINTSTIALP
jgi:hypothetical protein